MKHMHFVRVRSSNIEAIGYDVETHVMHTQFRDGSTYAYSDVPFFRVMNVLAAESIGRAHKAQIENKYQHKRIVVPRVVPQAREPRREAVSTRATTKKRGSLVAGTTSEPSPLAYVGNKRRGQP